MAQMIFSNSCYTNFSEEELKKVVDKFDATFYVNQNDDLQIDIDEATYDFFTHGWLEGRSPNKDLDCASYLIDNEELIQSGLDPLTHYVLCSGISGRTPASAKSIFDLHPHLTEKSVQLLYRVFKDCVSSESYLQTFVAGNHSHKVRNFAHHFLKIGYRAIPINELVTKAFIAPTRVQVLKESAVRLRDVISSLDDRCALLQPLTDLEAALNRLLEDQSAVLRPRVNLSNEEKYVLERIRLELDTGYYLTRHPDVEQQGIDPAEHYAFFGWREGYNPTRDFDTDFYLKNYPDVAAASVNPFYHYIVAGRAEGRVPAPAKNEAQRILSRLAHPRTFTSKSFLYNMPHLNQREVEGFFRGLKNSNRIALSVSHDCYVRNVGGTQIFVHDEQQKFNTLGFHYINISPTIPRLHLVPGHLDYNVNVVVDGELIGHASLKALASALHETQLRLDLLILHVLLGHKIELISQFLATTTPERVILWVHDYSTICSGFNLLRNDLQFCGAPPNTSTACRVCVYGADRPWHMNALAELFEIAKINVVSPSEAAMRIWWEGKHVEPEAAYIVPHWTLTDSFTQPSVPRRGRRNGFSPLKIAFVGYPKRHKGWHIYERIVASSMQNPNYEFFHLASLGFDTSNPAINFLPVDVTPDNRFGMIQTLRDNDIDLVVNASVWPETFAYVMYESLAAGALLLALTVSGNVSDVIMNTGSGKLFENADELVGFFSTGEVLNYYNSRPEARNKTNREISITGTTAALVEEGVI